MGYYLTLNAAGRNHRRSYLDGRSLVPIYRNGKIEDVYWTYSYSSVLDDEGNHGGILVTCMETTSLSLGNKR
jgi:hypothetical protein